jgi:hypothetical protein
MWMEWTIPIQKLEVSKIKTGLLQKSMKPLTPLSYVDGPFALQHLNILLPPLTIKEYEIQTGKLILHLQDSNPTLQKLSALQDSLLHSVFMNQRVWFPESSRSKDQIQNLFQPFLENNSLHLYCPIQTQEKKHFLHVWKQGNWHALTSPGLLEKGDTIRVALRLQGISYQTNPSTGLWTGRFRVQHRIFSIYHCS